MDTLSMRLAALTTEALAYATRDRIGGSRIAALRTFLHAYAGGLCVVCGQATSLDAARTASNYAEVGHLIPASTDAASSDRAGFIAPNCANMCHACNAAAGAYTFSAGDVLAHLVPLDWPILRKRTADDDGHARNAREARAVRGLPF